VLAASVALSLGDSHALSIAQPHCKHNGHRDAHIECHCGSHPLVLSGCDSYELSDATCDCHELSDAVNNSFALAGSHKYAYSEPHALQLGNGARARVQSS
jgi:hypothetical protein